MSHLFIRRLPMAFCRRARNSHSSKNVRLNEVEKLFFFNVSEVEIIFTPFIFIDDQSIKRKECSRSSDDLYFDVLNSYGFFEKRV